MLAVLVFIFSFLDIGNSLPCYSCATPGLNNSWHATGLPAFPKELVFNEKCGISPDSLAKDSQSVSDTSCDTVCFEIQIPLNGRYEIVRGCHGTFMAINNNANLTFRSVNSTLNCSITTIPSQPIFDDANNVVEAKTGFSLCQPSNDAGCNDKLLTTKEPKCGTSTTDTIGVNQCIQCSDFDGDGSCGKNYKDTCSGVYCTKTEGKIYGKYYIERGCASYSPFLVGGCAWSDIPTIMYNNVPFGNVFWRGKREIGTEVRLTKCFCEGDRCNITLSYFSWPMLLLIGIGTAFLLK